MSEKSIPGKLNILYVGSLNGYSNSYRRFKSLGLMGHTTKGIDTDRYIYGNLFQKFHHHLNIGPGISRLNREILHEISSKAPDILWIDNRPFVTARTLTRIRKNWPAIKIINLITDDPTGQYRHAWRLCLSTCSLYDCHFVQRSVNVDELKKAGARRVELCYRSYDPSFHRPLKLTDKDYKKYHTAVGFIGTYEGNREEYVAYLIKNNVPVKVIGDGWPTGKYWKIIQPHYAGPSVYKEEYVKAINGMDIALHFLRHANRDEQDSRTFEIPACGVFMIAEKSELHLTLFEDGKEAVYFDSKEAMLEKVKYYLARPVERAAIAANALLRCKESGYYHEERLKKVLSDIFSD